MKKKRKRVGLIITLSIIAVLSGAGIYGWSLIEKEHSQARSVEIKDLDFSNVEDGVYTGYYEGGMYGWRENEVEVTVNDGEVISIETVYSKMEVDEAILSELYFNVINAQSLDVDTVSEATLTCNGYLKSIEDALN